MTSGKLIIEEKEQMVTITIDMSERNVVNGEFNKQFNEILNRYENQTKFRTLLLTNKGNFFSNGFDPSVLVGASPEQVDESVGDAFRMLLRYFRLPMVTLAAMNGHSMGFGAILGLFSDYRFLQDGKIRIGFPEALIGLALPLSTSIVLQSIVGTNNCRDLSLWGKGVKPNEALDMKLVDAIYPAETLVSKSEKYLARFNAMSRQGIVANKKSYHYSLDNETLEKAIQLDCEGAKQLILSHDGQEGMKSILEARRPVFSS